MQHTPGRWLVQKSRSAGWRVYGEESGGTVIALIGGWTDEEKRANARLIAAAPELLAACCDAELGLTSSAPRIEAIVARLSATIAKAKGEPAPA